MLPKVILHFYFWYFIIPSHQTQILHCKLTVIFVMVYWLLLTKNIKTPHNMHETYLHNSRQWYGLWNTAASVRLSAQFPLHIVNNMATQVSGHQPHSNAVLCSLGNCDPPSSVSSWDIPQHVLGTSYSLAICLRCDNTDLIGWLLYCWLSFKLISITSLYLFHNSSLSKSHSNCHSKWQVSTISCMQQH